MTGRRVYIRVPQHGVCEDCDLRGDLTITGRPKIHPTYGYQLTTGCETCGGTGTSSRTGSLDAEAAYRLLTPKQRFVMERRLGHVDGRRYTQQDVAEAMGVSRQSVAELEKNARLRFTKLLNPAKNPAFRV